MAGSCSNFLSINGTKIPATTELIRLIISAAAIRRARVESPNQKNVLNPIYIANTKPFKIATANSLLNSQERFEEFICSKVKPRKTIVKV